MSKVTVRVASSNPSRLTPVTKMGETSAITASLYPALVSYWKDHLDSSPSNSTEGAGSAVPSMIAWARMSSGTNLKKYNQTTKESSKKQKRIGLKRVAPLFMR